MPPKRKRGGTAKKLAKMSEEERALYLEQQMLAEQEALKKKEEMLSQFLKDKLAKEEKSTTHNKKKLQVQWRQIMRKAKAAELRREIEELSELFERCVDRKDSIIQSLLQDLEEAEEQYRMALRTHLQQEDHLIELQDLRLDDLYSEFQTQLSAIRGEFDSERQRMLARHHKDVDDLADVMFAMEQEFAKQEEEATIKFQTTIDEIKNKNLEEKHALRLQLEQAVHDLQADLDKATQAYQASTAEKRQSFQMLKSRDDASAVEIRQQMKKLDKLQEKSTSLKTQISAHVRESESRNRALKLEKEAILVHFQELKGKVARLRDSERSKLTTLTLQSNATIKELERKLAKGEQILKVAEQCRRFETEVEKVLPFFSSSLTAEEEAEIEGVFSVEEGDAVAEAITQCTGMDNFWKHHNKVLLDKAALDHQKEVLTEENEHLKQLLKQYLDGLAVQPDVLDQSNPLVVINHRTNARLAVPVLDPRVKKPSQTVVEAAHAAKHLLIA